MTHQRPAVRLIFLIASLTIATSVGFAQPFRQPVAIVFFTEWSALLNPDAQTVIKRLESESELVATKPSR